MCRPKVILSITKNKRPPFAAGMKNKKPGDQKPGPKKEPPIPMVGEEKPEIILGACEKSKTGEEGNPSNSERALTDPTKPADQKSKIMEQFKMRAQIKPLDSGRIPACVKPASYNNDLELGTFTPSKFTWAGEQRKGLDCHITESTDIDDHTRKALDLEFFLSKPVPLPAEIRESLEFIRGAETNDVADFWTKQLMMVRKVVDDAKTIQQQWEDQIPNKEDRRPPSLRTVALLHLMKNFDLGGDRWIRQFVFGFPIIGELEQTGVYPRDDSKKGPDPIDGIWKDNLKRFQTRARASGVLNAQLLWNEAMTQVDKGWLAAPLPVDPKGNVATYNKGEVVVAFRFGVDQLDKVRPCDDLKYSTTNQYCTVWTPIKLPTWDHIGQMAIEIKDTQRPWAFLKTDHEAAYKQLPLDPEHARLAMVTLRHPTLGTWFAFPPQALLFGAEAAVIHYNCFSRILGVLVNKIFGIPLVTYFDDYGAMTPDELNKLALDTTKVFLLTLGVFLKDDKTKLGSTMTFLGVQGIFPSPTNGMTLEVSLPTDKRQKWADAIARILNLGVITHDQLEPLIGRLSFSQTSIFGRFGRPMLTHLYTKLNAHRYHPVLETKEIRTLQWRRTSLLNLASRTVRPRNDKPDWVVFTDAATSTSIIAAVLVNRGQFMENETIRHVFATKTGDYWAKLFEVANLIYGLETLALLATLYIPNTPLRNKNATFRIDNKNAFEAVVKNNSKSTIITAMTQLIWRKIRELGITAWFEWIPGNRNIADLPTRGAKITSKCPDQKEFGDLRALYCSIQSAKQEMDTGRPIIIHGEL